MPILGLPQHSQRYQHSLLFKTMAVLILIFIIPILFLYSLLIKDSTSQILGDVSSYISISLQNLSGIMDEIFTSVESVSNQMRADNVFDDISFDPALAREPRGYDSFLLCEQVSRRLYQYYLSSVYIYSLELYNPFCDAIFSSRVGATRRTMWHPSEAEILRIMGPDGREEKQWFLEETDGKKYLVTYFSPYYSNNPTLKLYARAALPVDVMMERFEQLFPDGQGTLFIMDATQSIFSPNGTDLEQIEMLCASSFEERAGWYESVQDGESYVTVHHRSSHTPWLYIVYAPVVRFSTSMNVLEKYLYYFIYCLAVIFVISLLFLYTHIIRPMRVISGKMRQAECGDLSVRIHFRQRDELGYVGHRFNVLLEKLQHLIQENYETRMLKNEFELKFIQTQLNEHFIYNTLDSIHWIADKHHVPQISSIIFTLSHFFRLTLNHGQDMVTVREVREILDCYLSLMNIRMDNLIQFSIYVEPGLEEERVVKYPFQPVVENAFQHGIREKNQGHIRILMTRGDERYIRYRVEDDGVGMTAERLEEVRRAISHHAARDASDDCFALINIDRQFKMYFGEDYSFEIDSKRGEGTRVTMVFPLGKEVSHA